MSDTLPRMRLLSGVRSGSSESASPLTHSSYHPDFPCWGVVPVVSKPAALRAGFQSIKGRRSANEDCVYANVESRLFIVADGIGGAAGGAIASRLVVDTISLLFAIVREKETVTNDSIPQLFRDAVEAARTAVAFRANQDDALREMGSTLSMGMISDRTLYLANIGDSRIYLIRNGSIRQLTHDDSVVQALLDSGSIDAEVARHHPLRHVITDSVNAARRSTVHVESHALLPGDLLLFTTDGLTDVVDPESIARIMLECQNPHTAATELVHAALENDSHDNITCLVVRIEG